MRSRTSGLLLVMVAVVTVVAGPPPVTSTAPDALVASTAGWLAWITASGVVTAVALAGAAAGRGRIAAICRAALAAYPRPVRRWAVAVVAGVAVTAGATPALASPPTRAVAADRTHDAGRHPLAPPLGWPSVLAPTPARTPADTADTTGPRQPLAAVVVRPGDCLWDIARRSLRRNATPNEVAAAWPRWWSANRAVIGPDPDVLHPGDRLRAPASNGRSSR